MKLYRLMGILLLLENYKKMTAQDLAEHFEISVRTIYRDLDTLSEAGFSLVSESGHGGGISLLDASRLQISAMNENELIKIAQKFSISHCSDTLDENIALKIRSQLSSQAKSAFDKIACTTLIDPTNWYGNDASTNQEYHLSTIQKAIVNNFCISLDYDSNTNSTLGRKIHPLGVCKKNNHWYLVGFCEIRNDYRIFKLSRISALALLEDKYSPHQDFDLNAFWISSTKEFSQVKDVKNSKSPLNDQMYIVEIRCKTSQLKALHGFDLMNYKGDVYEVNMISEQIAFSQLLMLEGLTVVSPESLINRMILHAHNILKKYS